MRTRREKSLRAIAVFILTLAPGVHAVAADERQSLEELRNTVINLLQGLVDQGVLTREKAAQIVKGAQDKAAADAAATAKTDEGAVRVPYIPQIVKDEISKQVAATVKPQVVTEVVREAKNERWGVPGALPDWLAGTHLSGSVLVREESLLYSGANQTGYYYDFNKVNAAGGIGKVGPSGLLNVSVNRVRFRGNARFAVETDFSDSIKAGIRLSTGNTADLVSPSQTLDGTAPYAFGIDNLYVRLDERTDTHFSWLSAVGGRFTSPWFSPTDLVFHKELNFNGVAVTGRLGLGDGSVDQPHLYLTFGAMPIQEITLSAQDKWLFGAQLGTVLDIGDTQRLRFAAAYYDYVNVEGRENAPNGSTLLDYRAPQFFRTGNTLFDIRNDNDPSTNLFALASKFHLANLAATYTIPIAERYQLVFAGDAVKNLGFSRREILKRTGLDVPPRTKGYQAEASFGYPSLLTAGAWRVLVGYRYLQRDAVIDAYTDSDFHFGGTDAVGYYATGEYGLANRVWMRLRYMSANEIDLAPYAVDTVQLDLATRF